MADPFIAEIRIFAGNFAPRYWAKCDGQLLAISQNTALFSLVGTTYGGNGKTTFGLPDLRGRAPMHTGAGAGLTSRALGESAGAEAVTLQPNQIPAHSHALLASNAPASSSDPQNRVLAAPQEDAFLPRGARSPVAMGPLSVAPTGESFPHNNLQPYLTLNFIIALQGVFPPRS